MKVESRQRQANIFCMLTNNHRFLLSESAFFLTFPMIITNLDRIMLWFQTTGASSLIFFAKYGKLLRIMSRSKILDKLQEIKISIGDSLAISWQSTSRQMNILRYVNSQYIDSLLLYPIFINPIPRAETPKSMPSGHSAAICRPHQGRKQKLP